MSLKGKVGLIIFSFFFFFTLETPM